MKNNKKITAIDYSTDEFTSAPHYIAQKRESCKSKHNPL